MSLVPAFKIGIWNAWIFMSIFLFQMLIIMLADKRIRERSHIPAEERQNKIEKYSGILGNIIWWLAISYSVFLPLHFDSAWFYIGLVIYIFGLILMIIATYNFITTPPDQLITTGIYSFLRHPMYMATFLICLGSGIASLSWLFILLSMILAFCLHNEALIEERFCLNKYGKTYQKYINKVSRWIG